MPIDQDIPLGNPFAIPDLWRNCEFVNFEKDAFQSLQEPLPAIELLDDLKHNEGVKSFGDKSLVLQPFTFGPIEDVDNLEDSEVSSAPELAEIPPILEEPVLTFPVTQNDDAASARLKTWEAFHDQSILEPRCTYLSDVGAHIFDVALSGHSADDGLIDSTALFSCFVHLGLGRDSVLYAFDKCQQSFTPRIEHGHMSGYSRESFRSLSDAMVEQGNLTRALRLLTTTLPEYRSLSASATAIFVEVRSTLALIESQVVAASPHLNTLLQLQKLFESPRTLVLHLSSLVSIAKSAISNVELLSIVFRLVQQAEYQELYIQQTLLRILNAVAQPWQTAVSAWLGLTTIGTGFWAFEYPTFVKKPVKEFGIGDLSDLDDDAWAFEPSGLPIFLGEAEGRSAFETGRNLLLLRKHIPSHPLLKRSNTAAEAWAHSEWDSSWPAIELVASRAQEYEQALLKAVAEFEDQACTENPANLAAAEKEDKSSHSLYPDDGVKGNLQESINWIEEPMSIAERMPKSHVESAKHEPLDLPLRIDLFGPPSSMIPMLYLQPWISAQSRLVNRACLRLLCEQFDLRSHLTLLHRYQLLSDGLFASRLCHALFDPELSASSERRESHDRAGISGLHLGHRETWPPTFSELRLALMGILTESYFTSGHAVRASLFREEMPGGLSFAIREMSEDEVQRCMDPNSVSALDFLQLQYRAPSPLGAIITTTVLKKYDVIFRLMLRVKRILFVMDRPPCDTKKLRASHHSRWGHWLRLRHISHHFVTSINNYFYEGIAKHWACLEEKILDVEKALDDGSNMFDDSIFALRSLHEEMLDRMMFTLFLRKRQTEVMRLLEEIFETILQAAGHASTHAANSGTLALYRALRKKIQIFVRVCQGLSEKTGPEGAKIEGTLDDISKQRQWSRTENDIGKLLLLLNLNDFYDT